VVRDEHGQLHKTWLPAAGKFWYSACCFDSEPDGHLTHLVHDGLASWTVGFRLQIPLVVSPKQCRGVGADVRQLEALVGEASRS